MEQIRLIYTGDASLSNVTVDESGITATGEGTQIQTSAYNTSYNDNAYVGYMYGSTGQTDSSTGYANTHKNTNNSTIKETVDDWYKTNILDAGYDGKVDKNAGFCNDRKVYTGTSWSGYGTAGYGGNKTIYEPLSRVMQWNNGNDSWKSMQTSTFKCSQENDLFTVNGASKGNKALQYSVGLITSDELLYAGSFGGINNPSFYLFTGQFYWTMSSSYLGISANSVVFFMGMTGEISSNNTNTSRGVRPVINLRADIQFKSGGSGTSENPYVVI